MIRSGLPHLIIGGVVSKPIPTPDEASKPFWDACDQGRLLIQYCTKCNRWQHPPRLACVECEQGNFLEFRPVSGRGTIYSYNVSYATAIRLFKDKVPLNLVIVQLDEDPSINLVTNLPGCPVGEVPIGAAVQVEFEEIAPGRRIPQFRLASS